MPIIYYPFMGKSVEMTNFARNLRMLMEHYGHTQMKLKERSGISQKTISNILNPNSDVSSPQFDHMVALASVYNIEVWHMLIPNAEIGMLLNRQIEKVVTNYTQVDKDSRENIARIAENEMRYCSNSKAETGQKRANSR